ncbi:hypothetical protein JOB18_029301 [Solea senegalensis]|uniref:Uncharacterized protein n=1 Tax=Solea senegalensis TaxID=28829 RepID=A0AAV6QKU8_SOLSE|nr:hypothetical protein JOB18_029301 [Solea senegalensis]
MQKLPLTLWSSPPASPAFTGTAFFLAAVAGRMIHTAPVGDTERTDSEFDRITPSDFIRVEGADNNLMHNDEE